MTATAKITSKHTPEPWSTRDCGTGFTIDRKEPWKQVAFIDNRMAPMETRKANASRIVDCVNACAGMADPVALIAEIRKELDGIVYDLGRIALNNVDQTAQAQRTLEGASALLAKLGEG